MRRKRRARAGKEPRPPGAGDGTEKAYRTLPEMKRDYVLERFAKKLEKAIGEGDEDPETYGNLSSTLMDLGRFGESEEWCRKGLALHPTSWLLHSSMGVIKRRTGEPAAAIPHHDEAMKCYKRDHGGEVSAFICNNKAAALYDLGRHDDALECVDAAIKADPDDEDALFNKLNMLIAASREDEAKAFTVELEESGRDMRELVGRYREHMKELESRHRVSKGA